MKFLKIILMLFLFSLSSKCNPFQSLIDYAEGVWNGIVSGISNAQKTHINTKDKVITIYSDDGMQPFEMTLHYDDVGEVGDYHVVAGRWDVTKGDRTTPKSVGKIMDKTYGFVVFKKGPNGTLQTALSKVYTQPIKVSDVTIKDINDSFIQHPLTSLSK